MLLNKFAPDATPALPAPAEKVVGLNPRPPPSAVGPANVYLIARPESLCVIGEVDPPVPPAVATAPPSTPPVPTVNLMTSPSISNSLSYL